jgi:ABC-type phosphate/phosphonate transport system substrate-binding protein
MYAMDDSMQAAWRALFLHAGILSPSLELPDNILFSDSVEQTLNPKTRLAHTCGYPLVTRYKGLLRPLNVPCFDMPGCEEGFYHSLFLVRDSDAARKLIDCEGYRAAVNRFDSNSGMNVFRAAIAKIKSTPATQAFFESVSVTGSHLDSVSAIARSEVDIASVDAISYHFISRFKPELCADLRVIGHSASTMGLPFVTRVNTLNLPGKSLTETLNQALKQSPDSYSVLNLKAFRGVNLLDYQGIQALERFAIDKGYPSLI